MYGRSKASKLNEEGRFDEAVAEAASAAALDPDDPEPLVDRAHAYAQLERYAEAVEDLEAALHLDERAGVLDEPLVDDAYFAALLGLARAEAASSPEEGARTLARYRARWPAGSHLGDVETWTRRLRGEVRAEFVKRRVDDP